MDRTRQEVDRCGAVEITREAAVFEVQLAERMPGLSIRIKVFESAGGFTARLNASPIDATGFPSGTSGFGPSVEEALADALHYLER